MPRLVWARLVARRAVRGQHVEQLPPRGRRSQRQCWSGSLGLQVEGRTQVYEMSELVRYQWVQQGGSQGRQPQRVQQAGLPSCCPPAPTVGCTLPSPVCALLLTMLGLTVVVGPLMLVVVVGPVMLGRGW